MYAIVRSAPRIQALRDFTLETAQEEMERQQRLKKEQNESFSRASSMDSVRSPVSARTPALSNVPEENAAFSIGDDEDEDDDHDHDSQLDRSQTRSPRSPVASGNNPRTPSIASAADDIPFQLRAMSEKARGKMPVGQPTFSRQNSTTSLNSMAAPMPTSNGMFSPTVEWVGFKFTLQQ